MPFGFSVYPKTKEEYLEEIGRILEDSETLMYLDTNILGYLYKLQKAARLEFYSWANNLIASVRLKIPAWVLSEYLAKLKDGQLDDYTAKSKESDEIRKKLENLFDVASLFVDDYVLKSAGFPGGE